MPDEQNNGQSQEVKETPVSMPNTDKPTVNPADPSGELPEGVSERTKAEFEKLKEHNRKLAEELEAAKAIQIGNKPPVLSVLDSLRPSPSYEEPNYTPTPDGVPQYPNQSQPMDPSANRLADDDGYVDESLLNRKVQNAEQRALTAEKRAEQAERLAKQASENVSRFGQSLVVEKTHEAFPEIDPSSPGFDPNLYEEVRKEVLYGMATRGTDDFFGAAKKIVEAKRKTLQQAQQIKQEQSDSKIQDTQLAKEIINQVGESKPTGDTYQRIIEASRRGVEGSIAERLKAAGYNF